MYKIMYRVPKEEAENEIEWLRGLMIFPAIYETIDFDTGKLYTMFGMIVGNDSALSIKLRHKKLETQVDWIIGQGNKR